MKAVFDAYKKKNRENFEEVIDRNYNRAKTILEENIDILHAMKDALMKYETLDAGQIDEPDGTQGSSRTSELA